MPIILLKYSSWGAAGILLGIAVAIWIGPETAAGFLIIIVICLLAMIVLRGLIQAWLALRGSQKDEEDGGEEQGGKVSQDAKDTDADEKAEAVKRAEDKGD